MRASLWTLGGLRAALRQIAGGWVKNSAIETATVTPTGSSIPISKPGGAGRLNFNWVEPHSTPGQRAVFVTRVDGSVDWAVVSTTVANLECIFKGTSLDISFTRFSGDAFPGTPVDGQRCYRTDHQQWYFYDVAASAWLSATVYEIAFGAGASVASGSYFKQLPLAGSANYSATYGEQFGFNVAVVGMVAIVGASSTCTFTVEDDGSDVTNGSLSLSSQTAKQDELMMSVAIAAGSIIGVKCTSGTATTFTSGRVRFRRIET